MFYIFLQGFREELLKPCNIFHTFHKPMSHEYYKKAVFKGRLINFYSTIYFIKNIFYKKIVFESNKKAPLFERGFPKLIFS